MKKLMVILLAVMMMTMLSNIGWADPKIPGQAIQPVEKALPSGFDRIKKLCDLYGKSNAEGVVGLEWSTDKELIVMGYFPDQAVLICYGDKVAKTADGYAYGVEQNEYWWFNPITREQKPIDKEAACKKVNELVDKYEKVKGLK